jgi:predicted transcriptional regulator YdeE
MKKPKITQKEAMVIAGVAGSGDETAKAWEAFMKIQKMHPLTNQAKEDAAEGYEVRLYPPEGMGKILVGVPVEDANVPAEYKTISLPPAAYAEFEIYPAKGYESSNGEMDRWLEDNNSTYKQALFEGMKYIVEVYDARFKGEKDPLSVIGCLVPLVPVAAENPLAKMVAGAVQEFSGRIEQYAGADIRKKVMWGAEKMPGILDSVKGALDYKEAIERLEKLVDKPTCNKIMTACGCACQSLYDQAALKAKELRQKYATEEEFLADFKAFDNGTLIELKGKDIIQRFSPRKLFPNMPEMRCACMLIGGLPQGTYASPTVCQCSRGFTEKRWETILGRPVKVDVVSTPIINDVEECTFIIHL